MCVVVCYSSSRKLIHALLSRSLGSLTASLISVAWVRRLRLWRNHSRLKGPSWRCWCLGGGHTAFGPDPLTLNTVAHRGGRWKLHPKGPEWLGPAGGGGAGWWHGAEGCKQDTVWTLSCWRRSGVEVFVSFSVVSDQI